MRREALFLRDVLEAADAVVGFLAGIDREAFLQSDLIRSAVLHKLTIIGEAAARLPQELRDRYPLIPWRQIVGFRNIAVHAYFSVDWQIVWTAASENVPELRRDVADIVAREFSDLRLRDATDCS